MGLNFHYYDGLQPKMSAGIINEHECIFNILSDFLKTNVTCSHLSPSTTPCPVWVKSKGAFSPHITFGLIFPRTYSADLNIHLFASASDPRPTPAPLDLFNMDKPAQGQTLLM